MKDARPTNEKLAELADTTPIAGTPGDRRWDLLNALSEVERRERAADDYRAVFEAQARFWDALAGAITKLSDAAVERLTKK